MSNKPTLPCGKCASKNTHWRNTPPGGGLLGQIKEKLLSLAAAGTLPGGQKFLVCKDCGHVSVVFVR